MPARRSIGFATLGVALIAGVLLGVKSFLPVEGFVFNQIYKSGYWGRHPSGLGSSGPGSTELVTREYRKFIETLIRQEGIKTVVDAGCGDWEFSQHIDWGGAQYIGIDVSSVVLDRVIAQYSKPNIMFSEASLVEVLPPADLLIVKDVLQHLPIDDISKFIHNNLRPGRYKIAVLTNDRAANGADNNSNIVRGDYRKIDLASPPFNVHGLEDFDLFKSIPATEKVVQVLRFD